MHTRTETRLTWIWIWIWIENAIWTWSGGSHLWSVLVSGWWTLPSPEGMRSLSQAVSPGQTRHYGKKHFKAKCVPNNKKKGQEVTAIALYMPLSEGLHHILVFNRFDTKYLI